MEEKKTFGAKEAFRRISCMVAEHMGSCWAFGVACSLILIWAITGPVFHFSDTWQLVINTATTIVTFLMVFLIQNTQNRDTAAMQIKLDELIRAVKGAQNSMLNIEELDDATLELFRARYEKLAVAARKKLEQS